MQFYNPITVYIYEVELPAANLKSIKLTTCCKRFANIKTKMLVHNTRLHISMTVFSTKSVHLVVTSIFLGSHINCAQLLRNVKILNVLGH